MKAFFESLKKDYSSPTSMKDDDGRVAGQIDLLDGILGNTVKNRRVKRSLSMPVGFIESCDVAFYGPMLVPFVSNTKYRTDVSDPTTKQTLDKLTEAVMIHAVHSLLHFGRVYVQQGCVEDPDGGFPIQKKYAPYSTMIQNSDLALIFENGNPLMLYLRYPDLNNAFNIQQSPTMVNSEFGNNLDLIKAGIFELHAKFLKSL